MSNSDDTLDRLGSADPNVAGLALGELQAQGEAAVPALLRALTSDNVGARRMAIEGLGDIASASSEDGVRAALADQDGQVRSLAAVALARLGAPDALQALADTLDDWPDLAHAEMSRSAYELPRLGRRALTVAIPLLASPVWTDRAKGAWVIRQVLGQANADPDLVELHAIVDRFDADGPAEERNRTASEAAEWLRVSERG